MNHYQAIDAAVDIAFGDDDLDEDQLKQAAEAQEVKEILFLLVNEEVEITEENMRKIKDLKQQASARWLSAALAYDARR
jgi:hypothetical protein